MTLTRFVFKSHKWLAAVTGIFALLWFASAVAMLVPRNLVTRVSDAKSGTRPRLNFKGIVISVPQAIAAVEAASGGKAVAIGISVGSLEGRLSYRIDTEGSGVWWVNATDGAVTQIDAQVARRLVLASGVVADESLRPTELLTANGPDYPFGTLPAYRLEAEKGGLVFTVEQGTGNVQRSSTLARWYRFVTGWHTLNFLKPFLGGVGVRLLMWVLAIVGTGMTLFGLWILWLQFRQWRQMQHHA